MGNTGNRAAQKREMLWTGGLCTIQSAITSGDEDEPLFKLASGSRKLIPTFDEKS